MPLILAAVGLIACGVYFFGGASSPRENPEAKTPAWTERVEPLNQQFKQSGKEAMDVVSHRGQASRTTHIQLTRQDVDMDCMRKLYAAGKSSQDQKVRATALEKALQEAQRIPEAKDARTGEALQRRLPSITPGLATALEHGDAQTFSIFLFDNCAEDGDVVEIILNDESFAIVPITHQGATLSVPLVKGSPTSITLRGIRDGGGGITVSFKTSSGIYFTRAMAEQEVQRLGTVGL